MEAIAALYGSDSSDNEDHDGSLTPPQRDDSTTRLKSESSCDHDGTIDDRSIQNHTLKRKRNDEPQHQWKRTFAHVDGNWPSHIKVNIPVAGDILRLIKHVLDEARCVLGDALGIVSILNESVDGGELHLSLSRPFVLTYDQIDEFVDKLKSALKWRTR
jgi:hypothetical protein